VAAGHDEGVDTGIAGGLNFSPDRPDLFQPHSSMMLPPCGGVVGIDMQVLEQGPNSQASAG